ncbi:DUF479 domain-containing protein [Klebsiella pneumoniae]|uniref:DUF479 domain-containing protein n=1 Tax=Klebsiella pneumoniae TaxID=573 RepID=A0A939NLB8_KLEPN|nr:DUF479 domain-containing protein [Klebsiella pneumoniae]
MLPDSPPRFVNLNQYLWSERWLELSGNGFYSARAEWHGQPPSTSRGTTRLWQDLDTHYDRLETQFWRFYPQMMRRAENKQL